jgi:hypothetical protein
MGLGSLASLPGEEKMRLYAWSAFVGQGIRLLEMEAGAGYCSISRLRLGECIHCHSGLHQQLRGERPNDMTQYGPTKWARGALRYNKMHRKQRHREQLPREYMLERGRVPVTRTSTRTRAIRFATTGELARPTPTPRPKVLIRKARTN